MTQDLLQIWESLERPRLLVLGDLVLDRYCFGDAQRLSPEAPALLLRAERTEERLGGAAAVAALLRGLEAEVSVAGVTGADDDGRQLRQLLDAADIHPAYLPCDPGRPTTVKQRLMTHGPCGEARQLLRVDQESRQPLSPALEEQLAETLTARLFDYGAVLVSDYAKGVCTPGLLASILSAAAQRRVPVLIDPACGTDFGRYRGAALLAPNRAAAQAASGITLASAADGLLAGRRLSARYGAGAVLVKLDRDGLALTQSGTAGLVVSATTRTVCDVAGAGDMVLAVAGLCCAEGIGWEETARLAGVAAGLEVGRLGVVPLRRAEVADELARQLCGSAAKVVTLPRLLELAAIHRGAGCSLVFTNGCFDLLHSGHVNCLEEAARLGDVLIVALNSDACVRRLKGPGRPVIREQERAALVAALECVDHVVLFDELTPHELLRLLRPDVLVKGGTYTAEEVVGREVVEGYGGTVCVTSWRPGISTTRLLTALRGGTVPAAS
jgi:D-beta-D-heptose 7-phosphate kinase/D-beta-D-heptose 1-phosphate adenosyltransferase